MDRPPALWPVSPREVRWGFAGPSRVRGRALDIGGLQLLDRLTGQPALSPLSAHPSPLVRFTSHLSPLTPHLSFVSPLTPLRSPLTSRSFHLSPLTYCPLPSHPLSPLAPRISPLALSGPSPLKSVPSPFAAPPFCAPQSPRRPASLLAMQPAAPLLSSTAAPRTARAPACGRTRSTASTSAGTSRWYQLSTAHDPCS